MADRVEIIEETTVVEIDETHVEVVTIGIQGPPGSTDFPVTSVNGLLGDVELDAGDVGAASLADLADTQSDIDAHQSRTDNPHSVTKAQVGLGSVDNTSDMAKPVSTATQTALNTKYDASNPAGYVNPSQASSAAPVQSVAGKTGTVSLVKSDVGLSNVDNTSDATKPVSTAQQAALDEKRNVETGNTVVYVRNNLGVDTAIPYSSAATGLTIAYRDSGGRFNANAPVTGSNVANMTYVDGLNAGAVHLTGNEAITGDKTFTGDVFSVTTGFGDASSPSKLITVNQAGATPVQIASQFIGEGTASSAPARSSIVNARFSANGNAPANVFAKSRANSSTSRASVISGDGLGNIGFNGDDGTNLIEAARIRAIVTGSVGTGSVPARLEFMTADAGAGQANTGMVLWNDNKVSINYGSTAQSTTLAVNGTGFFNGNVAGLDPVLDSHFVTKGYSDRSGEGRAPGGHNLITNPGFEEFATGYSGVNGATVTTVTSPVRTGQRAGQVAFPTAAGDSGIRLMGTNISLAPNRVYVASAYIWLPSTNTPGSVRLSVQGSGLIPATGAVTTNVQVAFPDTLTDQWVQLQVAFQMPTTNPGVNIYVIASNTTSGQLMYVDDVAVQLAQDALVTTESGQIWSASVRDRIYMYDGSAIAIGTGAGAMIGTTSTQKIGFYGAAPVGRQSASNDLGTVLSNLGLRTSGTGYPVSTTGNAALLGSVRFNAATITAATTLTTSSVMNQRANATTGAFNVTLPTTTTAGFEFLIKKVDSSVNVVTVVGTIDGQANYELSAQGKYVRVITTTVSGSFDIVGNN